jgi:hypothetical protein
MIFNLSKRIAIGNIIKQSIIFAIGLAILLVVYTPSFAQTLPKQNIRISPILQNITLLPNSSQTFPITIENLADTPLGMHIDILPFDPDNPDTSLHPLTRQSLVSFSTVSEKDIILPEHGKKVIQLTIQTPTNGTGGYYEAIAYTPFISTQKRITQPILLSKFLGFVFANIGVTDLKEAAKYITITNFSPKEYILDHGNPIIDFTIKNNYKTHVIGKPFLTITPLLSTPKTYLFEEKYVFPGSERSWEKTFTLPMHIFYKAHLELSVGGGNMVSADTWFIILPYKLVLSSIIAFALILFTLLRKRLAKALKILIRG